MDPSEVVRRRGGLATRADLLQVTTRADLDGALRSGDLVRVGRGRYTSAEVAAAPAAAHAVNGVLSLTSAALHHGWEVLHPPEVPHVLLPRKRRVSAGRRAGIVVHRGDLGPGDREGPATSRPVTLTQCLRALPHDEALAVADSALRAGEVALLRHVAESVRGPGSDKVRALVAAARGEAANPFESALRSIALSVPGLDVEPQVVVSSPHVWARPDLVDVCHRLVVEAESYEWHGDRAGFRKDVRRYTLLVADGWTVLRFIWEDVLFRPDRVRQVLARAVRLTDARTQLTSRSAAAA
jgi:very-short-patch-repair endonuclease